MRRGTFRTNLGSGEAAGVNQLTGMTDAWGVVLRRHAIANGIDDRALNRLVKNGSLIRLRHGAYADRSVFLAADATGRHLMLCHAVMQQYGDHVALSHSSAALAQGGPDWGIDLANAHLTHLSGGGRKGSRIVHHEGGCRVGDLRRHNDHWITTPGRSALDTASVSGAEAGLVQANHFLHEKLTSLAELEAMAKAAEYWPRTLVHHPVLHLADGRIESVGETRSQFLFWSQGLPAPVPQYEILHPSGIPAGRVDFAWPEHRVMLEFDGMAKYHRYRREGETISQMVEREKRREDLLRELTGWWMIRLDWADLDVPVATAKRIWQKLQFAPAA
jgi:hypothetical protein